MVEGNWFTSNFKKNELKAKAKVEALDFDEDLDTIIAEEATLIRWIP